MDKLIYYCLTCYEQLLPFNQTFNDEEFTLTDIITKCNLDRALLENMIFNLYHFDEIIQMIHWMI